MLNFVLPKLSEASTLPIEYLYCIISKRVRGTQDGAARSEVKEEDRAQPGPGDMSGAIYPGGIDRISVNC